MLSSQLLLHYTLSSSSSSSSPWRLPLQSGHAGLPSIPSKVPLPRLHFSLPITRPSNHPPFAPLLLLLLPSLSPGINCRKAAPTNQSPSFCIWVGRLLAVPSVPAPAQAPQPAMFLCRRWVLVSGTVKVSIFYRLWVGIKTMAGCSAAAPAGVPRRRSGHWQAVEEGVRGGRHQVPECSVRYVLRLLRLAGPRCRRACCCGGIGEVLRAGDAVYTEVASSLLRPISGCSTSRRQGHPCCFCSQNWLHLG